MFFIDNYEAVARLTFDILQGHIYNSTSRIRNRKEKKSWLGYAQGYLLYRDVNNHSMTAIRISPETLEQDGTVILPGMFQLVSLPSQMIFRNI